MNLKTALAKNFNYRLLFIAGLSTLVITLFFCSRILIWSQARSGQQLNDWVLNVIPAYDLSMLIFLVIYGPILLCLKELWNEPEQLVVAFFSYSILVWFRMGTIYAVPLNPPAALVPLLDPMVNWATSSSIITKDLFFSGHTATMALLFLLSKNRINRAIFFVGTFVIGALVMIQHIHYTIDVLAAPGFAALSYYLVEKYARASLRNFVSKESSLSI